MNMFNRRRFITMTTGLAALLPLALVGCQAKNEAPDAPLLILDAPPSTLAALRGKPALLTFWATSCPGCIEEIPLLSALHQDYAARGLSVIGVAMSYDPEAQVRALVQRKAIPYPIALDKGGALSAAMGVVRLTPTTFLLDAQGQVVYQKIGIFDMDKVKGLIEGLLPKA